MAKMPNVRAHQPRGVTRTGRPPIVPQQNRGTVTPPPVVPLQAAQDVVNQVNANCPGMCPPGC